MKTLKDKIKNDNLNYHNVPVINFRFEDVKNSFIEFENIMSKIEVDELKKDNFETVAVIERLRILYKKVFGDWKEK